MRDHVSFSADYPKAPTADRPAGSELVDALCRHLEQLGYRVECEPTDYSHELRIEKGPVGFSGMLGLVDDDDAEWLFFAESRLGRFARLFGKRDEAAHRELLESIHAFLESESQIEEICWYSQAEWNRFDRKGHPHPGR